jgi:proline-specific peptidase
MTVMKFGKTAVGLVLGLGATIVCAGTPSLDSINTGLTSNDATSPIHGSSVQEGYIPFQHPTIPASLNAKTWYRVSGKLDPHRGTKCGKRPLVALHGGPGIPSIYLWKTFDEFSKRTGRPVVFYDQFGCGNSTRYREKKGDEAFWTVQLFLDELDNLLRGLGIGGDYDLYGHSWGAMLAAKHAVVSMPKGLKSLILASGPAKISTWGETCQTLLETLGKDVQDAVNKHEADGTTDDPEYQEAITKFYKAFVCRLDPWPVDFEAALGAVTEDDTVYSTMQGPSEVSIIGSLRGKALIPTQLVSKLLLIKYLKTST